MPEKAAYCFGKTVQRPYEDTVARTRESLQNQGFGVLSEIDVQDKLKEKLGLDFQPYIILGACNPKLASQALSAEPNLGVLLPCNVIVYRSEEGGTRVMAMDPVAALSLVDNPEVERIAHQVRDLLSKALESI
ncbi:MAG: DUF302 domain-containing protein [Desulfuromonadales bacterium]|nr:DUF302 domain-containing protein [Desulfuromonadales bacterium]NIS41093.1 DUF302 domain-containing protein [Desulfuromonadales bacterium]